MAQESEASPSVLVAYDGDNITRVLAGHGQRLSYRKMKAVLHSWFGRANLEQHLFHSTSSNPEVGAAIERFFTYVGYVGVEVHRWCDGWGGYPDDWMTAQVRQLVSEREPQVLVIVSGDKKCYAPFVQSIQRPGLRVMMVSPMVMRWPWDVEAHCLPFLARQFTGLLETPEQPMRFDIGPGVSIRGKKPVRASAH